MTALADNPVRLSKKARRRLAAVPRIPDHRELNPTTSHPLPRNASPQREGPPLSCATDLSPGQCSSTLPTTPTPHPSAAPVSTPDLPSGPLPFAISESAASAALVSSAASAESAASAAPSPSPLCALSASTANPVFASLLPDYLTANFSLPALAERHNISLLDLIELLDSPQFIELIDRLNAIAERRAATVALHARPGALAGLESVIATTTNPETARKAAATLVRASDRALMPRRAQPQINTTQPEAPPETDATSTSPPDPASTPP